MQNLNEVVDWTIRKVGKKLVIATPLAAGKPNHLLNAFYQKAKKDNSIQLTIATALTLEKPKGKSLLEKRFMQPMAERVFGNYPDLYYELERNRLPENIRVVEFYFPAGKYLGNTQAQQDYVSCNYTHVARDMMDRGVNVLVQMMAKTDEPGEKRLSFSCNSDVTKDLVDLLRKSERPHVVIGQVNGELPYMYGDSLVDTDFFDKVIDEPLQYYKIFGPPKMSVTDADFMIGLYASSLIKDDGELQVGIGSLGDAVIYAMVLRQKENTYYKKVLSELKITKRFSNTISEIGGVEKFEKGLFGATEMVVDGFMELYQHGILKRQVYDHIGLQRLLNEGRIQEEFDKTSILEVLVEKGIIAPMLSRKDFDFLVYWGVFSDNLAFENGMIKLQDGTEIVPDLLEFRDKNKILENCMGSKLKHGHLVHGGFFLGPQKFYTWLKEMQPSERRLFAMKSVQQINQLYGHEELDRLHRRNARFVNTCMMTTLSGAHVSDGIDDGRVVSGVGGQYNFVAMAQELPDGRSILTMRSTRSKEGITLSNIVFNYGHITIPRHLRDILVTEYGIANLRGKTDCEIIKELLNVCDSRFQEGLMDQAKEAGKLPYDYEIPEAFQNNYPEAYIKKLNEFKKDGHFNAFPFGTDLTEVEKKVGKALKTLKALKEKGSLIFLPFLLSAFFSGKKTQDHELLERLKLNKPTNFTEWFYQKLLVRMFRKLSY